MIRFLHRYSKIHFSITFMPLVRFVDNGQAALFSFPVFVNIFPLRRGITFPGYSNDFRISCTWKSGILHWQKITTQTQAACIYTCSHLVRFSLFLWTTNIAVLCGFFLSPFFSRLKLLIWEKAGLCPAAFVLRVWLPVNQTTSVEWQWIRMGRLNIHLTFRQHFACNSLLPPKCFSRGCWTAVLWLFQAGDISSHCCNLGRHASSQVHTEIPLADQTLTLYDATFLIKYPTD